MNLDKLRGALAEQRITQEMLAKRLNISLLSVQPLVNSCKLFMHVVENCTPAPSLIKNC